MINDDGRDNDLIQLIQELSTARRNFRSYSMNLKQKFQQQNQDIFKHLTKIRDQLNEKVNKFSVLAQHVLGRISSIWETVFSIMQTLIDMGYRNWMIGLTACVAGLVVTLFIQIPLSLSYCHVETFASSTFILSTVVIVVFSFLLGFFVIFAALVGGHGEVFICRMLFEPDFNVLRKLFDNPGIIYANAPTSGIFQELLVAADGVQFSNVSLPIVLNECRRNQSTYEVFQIDRLLNLSHELNYENYQKLAESINGIEATANAFSSLTVKSQSIIGNLLRNVNASFTTYQIELSQISPENELSHFIDQMQRVSLQILDFSTVSRMAALTSTAKRIQSTILQPLEALKNEVVFHLTALELHMNPWVVQLKKTRENLSQTQDFLNSKAFGEVCANYSENFRERLRLSLEVYKNETNVSLHENFGCKPIYDVFNGLRWLICGHIVDSINGQ